MAEIKLTKGKYALVDDADFEWLNQWKWHLVFGKYAAHRLPPDERYAHGKYIYMHRLIMDTPDNMDTDHINGDGLDNRRSNLRTCTTSQNLMNRMGSSITGYKGVAPQGAKFTARYCGRANGKTNTKYLGLFDTALLAAKAYDDYVYNLFGEFAYLNLGKRG